MCIWPQSSECAPRTRSTDISGELVGNTESWATESESASWQDLQGCKWTSRLEKFTSTGELGFFFLGSVKIKVKFTQAGVFSFFFPASLKQIFDSPSLTPTDIIVSASHSVVSDSFGTHGCSLPGSPIHGIQQARILDWVAIPLT